MSKGNGNGKAAGNALVEASMSVVGMGTARARTEVTIMARPRARAVTQAKAVAMAIAKAVVRACGKRKPRAIWRSELTIWVVCTLGIKSCPASKSQPQLLWAPEVPLL